jgi:hypothetical protein
MANQFKISEKVMENILSNAISIKSKEPQNYEHMFKILMDNLNDTAKESIVHLSLIEASNLKWLCKTYTTVLS